MIKQTRSSEKSYWNLCKAVSFNFQTAEWMSALTIVLKQYSPSQVLKLIPESLDRKVELYKTKSYV